MSKDNKFKLIAAGLAAGAGASYAALSHKLFQFTCARDAEWNYGGKNNKGKDGETKEAAPLSRYGSAPEKDREWLKSQLMEEAVIRSSVDDTMLFGRYFSCEAPKRKILCVHGYRASANSDFSGMAKWLHDNDCALLLIDQRACGHSEGDYVTFGAKEKYDVLDWLDWLADRGPKNIPIYLFGVSMGATTVCCASEFDLPKETAGIIADCGFTSMKDILAKSAKEWFHLPKYPLLWSVGSECESAAHFRIQDADAESALRKCRVPVLFIHGTADEFVPPSQAIRNYHACASKYKDILWIDGAGHACSMYQDPQKYQMAVSDFFTEAEKEAK